MKNAITSSTSIARTGLCDMRLEGDKCDQLQELLDEVEAMKRVNEDYFYFFGSKLWNCITNYRHNVQPRAYLKTYLCICFMLIKL